MPNPRQPLFAKVMLVFGAFVGASLAPAGAEDLAVEQAEPIAVAEAAPVLLSGPQVYNEVCIACHAPPGLGGAPALGDAAAWAPRIAQGADMLIDHALNGFSSSKGVMPRKGGRLDLSDAEIVGAVEYMLEQAAE